jgi:hypothetical protein
MGWPAAHAALHAAACCADRMLLVCIMPAHRVGDESTRWAQFKPAAPGTAFAYQFTPNQVRTRVWQRAASGTHIHTN